MMIKLRVNLFSVGLYYIYNVRDTMNIHDKKTTILAELKVAGTTVKELADRYNVSPMTIGSWRRKEREGLAKVETQELADIPKAVVVEVVEELS